MEGSGDTVVKKLKMSAEETAEAGGARTAEDGGARTAEDGEANGAGDDPLKHFADKDKFYGTAEGYWRGVAPTVNGMLGGFGHISTTDISGSRRFLDKFMSVEATGRGRAVDCGAGIGRISKRLLLPVFESVDLVEITQEFLDQAPDHVGSALVPKLGRLLCCGLQDFKPEPGHYDVIWSQWVLGHLTDTDLVAFFRRCKAGLAPNGLMFVKENLTNGSTDYEYDEDDSSYTRSRALIVKLMREAGLVIMGEEKQKKFPKELFEVRMFALK